MIQLGYDEIIAKIKEEKEISVDELNKRIKAKMDQLSGLISKDGAAYIVANELGVKLIRANGMLKVKDILVGMRSVETAGRVIRKFPVNEFQKDGKSGKVGSFIIADETGQVRITCWHEMCQIMEKFSEGDIIKVVGGYVRENRGSKEIHLNDRSKLILNPENVVIAEIRPQAAAASSAAQRPEAPRKKISELTDKDTNVELFATIVQVFDPRFFEVCPSCSKKVLSRDDGYMCEEHGTVKPVYSIVLNTVMDDGSSNIRVVFFRNQALRLLKINEQQLQDLRLAGGSFDALKTDLLGEQVRIIGKATNNSMFNRLEFIANLVFRDVNPEDEIKRLKADANTATSISATVASTQPSLPAAKPAAPKQQNSVDYVELEDL
jgi:replication factor A1